MICVTLAIVAVLVALAGGEPLLQYDAGAIAGGQWWRIITCHFTHWTADHLMWDAVTFAALGFACERMHRRATLACLAVAAIAIPLAIAAAMPELATYRGLSGLDSALFMLLAVFVVRRSWAGGGRWLGIAAAAAIAGFAGKTMFEVATGTTLFVESSGAFVPIPLSHLAGAAAGLVIGAVAHLRWATHDTQVMRLRPDSLLR